MVKILVQLVPDKIMVRMVSVTAMVRLVPVKVTVQMVTVKAILLLVPVNMMLQMVPVKAVVVLVHVKILVHMVLVKGMVLLVLVKIMVLLVPSILDFIAVGSRLGKDTVGSCPDIRTFVSYLDCASVRNCPDDSAVGSSPG
jgi:hypothetical protein